MTACLHDLPAWGLAILIFLFRIVDVSIGTLRTVSTVRGYIRLSMILGFFEILIWITAVSQVIAHIHEHPLLILAYACGFSAGNAIGIWVEKKLAFGTNVIRMFSEQDTETLVSTLRDLGQRVTTFEGHGRDGIRTLLYMVCPRKETARLIEKAKEIDPDVVFFIESVQESTPVSPLPGPTGWRAVLKKK